jgi:multidrug resistance efflux pump
MNTNRTPRTILVIVLLIAAVAGAFWYFNSRNNAAAGGALSASGTVETTEIAIAPELSGKVLEVNVQEGDTVKTGDVLFRLDDTLLQSQRRQALAALDTAQASVASAAAAIATAQTQHEIVLNNSLAQDKGNRVAGWFATKPGEFDQPMWYFDKQQQMDATQTEIDAAQKALLAAQTKQKNVEEKASSSDFISAEKALMQARVAFEVAKQVVDLTGGVTGSTSYVPMPKGLPYRAQIHVRKWLEENQTDLHDSAQSIYDDAQSALDDAQTAYDDALGTDGATDVFKARADVAVAQERYYTTQDYLRSLLSGPDSLQVQAAQKGLDQAQSAEAQAQAAVNQAQASLDLLDTQITKLTVKAPVDGVVLTRTAEPGSVVNAGGVLLTLGRLDDLTITVYVPEDRMGEVSLGQVASVKVDSFPGQTFEATVSYIADQAEFTPRNVQTVEGRKNTVFAVKLKLSDTSGNLKPGMPADVTFGIK